MMKAWACGAVMLVASGCGLMDKDKDSNNKGAGIPNRSLSSLPQINNTVDEQGWLQVGQSLSKSMSPVRGKFQLDSPTSSKSGRFSIHSFTKSSESMTACTGLGVASRGINELVDGTLNGLEQVIRSQQFDSLEGFNKVPAGEGEAFAYSVDFSSEALMELIYSSASLTDLSSGRSFAFPRSDDSESDGEFDPPSDRQGESPRSDDAMPIEDLRLTGRLYGQGNDSELGLYLTGQLSGKIGGQPASLDFKTGVYGHVEDRVVKLGLGMIFATQGAVISLDTLLGFQASSEPSVELEMTANSAIDGQVQNMSWGGSATILADDSMKIRFYADDGVNPPMDQSRTFPASRFGGYQCR